MHLAALISRYLLGIIFTMSGLSIILLKGQAPPMPPGIANDFQTVYFNSHWVEFVDAVQLIAGVMLLFKKYVPLALVALAGVIFNMYVFHITMQPIGVIAPIVLTVCWILVAQQYRSVLAPLLDANPPITS
jgi:putative oxidoreductase